jgi:multidrug resistance protein, MATE family
MVFQRSPVGPPTLRSLFFFAVPMIVSQASETVMLFVDRLFLSWLGKLHIAASMSGGLSAFAFVSLFAGIAGYTNAIVAQYHGAGRPDRCVQTVSNAAYLSLLFIPVILLLVTPLGRLFAVAGHSPEQIALELPYFRILMFGAGLVLFRQLLAGFFLGIGRTKAVMVANILGVLVNVPVNYVLIFGRFGFPALGITGAALGTVAGSFVIFLTLLIFFLRDRAFRVSRDQRPFLFRGELFLRIVRYGFPVGLELFLNVFSFNVFVQLMHSMGANVAAATTITFNYDMVAFIPMIGLGVAVTALVAQQMGAGNPDGATKATYLALRVGYSYAGVMMLLFLFATRPLVSLFGAGFGPEDQELINLAVSMLRLAALYTLADVTQLVFSGALRGAGDTRAVMLISVGSHWVFAGIAVIGIRVLGLSPIVMWVLFIAFVLSLGVMVVLRFRRGTWRSLRVIEGPETSPEVHKPKVVIESEWI